MPRKLDLSKPCGTLAGVHYRLYVVKGKARQFQCVDCDRQALDWSWIHDTDKFDIENYEPRCRRCHKIYDGGLPSFEGHKHTDEWKQKRSKIMTGMPSNNNNRDAYGRYATTDGGG